jgi:hypothetical protein
MPQPVMLRGSLSAMLDELDDWCGTKPPRKFPPRGPGVRDVLVAVAIHNLAAQISNPKIRSDLQGLAVDLYRSGGQSIAG